MARLMISTTSDFLNIGVLPSSNQLQQYGSTQIKQPFHRAIDVIPFRVAAGPGSARFTFPAVGKVIVVTLGVGRRSGP